MPYLIRESTRTLFPDTPQMRARPDMRAATQAEVDAIVSGKPLIPVVAAVNIAPEQASVVAPVADSDVIALQPADPIDEAIAAASRDIDTITDLEQLVQVGAQYGETLDPATGLEALRAAVKAAVTRTLRGT